MKLRNSKRQYLKKKKKTLTKCQSFFSISAALCHSTSYHKYKNKLKNVSTGKISSMHLNSILDEE